MQNTESPGTTDQQVEQRMDNLGLTAPRVTRAGLSAKIVKVDYVQPEGTTLTIAIATLENGFTVIGESAAASPENFDAQIGKDLAFAKVIDRLWPLEGYLLKQQLYEGKLRENGPADTAHPEYMARIAHEVNRAYCAALGDASQPAWDDAPQWQKDSAIAGVRFHMDRPDATPENSHENWLADKIAAGWTWGPVKDPAKKQHPCIVPYADLPQEQRVKDYLFRGVLHAIARMP